MKRIRQKATRLEGMVEKEFLMSGFKIIYALLDIVGKFSNKYYGYSVKIR